MEDVMSKKKRLAIIKEIDKKLAKLKELCVDDADEAVIYVRINTLLAEAECKIKNKARWCNVYYINEGMAKDLLYEGDEMSCRNYTRHHIKKCPELSDKLIIIPSW